MKEKTISGQNFSQTQPASSDIQSKDPNNSTAVARRSFIKGLGVVGATLLPGAALLKAQSSSSGKLSKGDADLLRFALWAEIVESDLWTQYNELGGATAPNDGAANPGNPPYVAALQNLDGDMPQYITDNNDDELSHAAFLDAYLRAHGAESVNLDQFRILQGSTATGVDKTKIGKRLTNLLSLNVDLSWYTRYRSGENPDLGANIAGPFTISNQPAIPLNDSDTPPNVVVPPGPIPTNNSPAQRIQAIANTAGFHFAFIEQGGTSLYPTLALKATSEEVLRILLSIGGVEIDHFSLWHDKAGNAVAQPLAGVTDPETKLTFPDLNDPATLAALHLQLELTQTNKIQPEPCAFLQTSLPACSIIRPTSTQLGGAVATVNSFAADGLFQGLPEAFMTLSMQLATAADNAKRHGHSFDLI
jgi:hypothetical protein